MATRYGGRWEVVGDLGAGGQANVFKVRDLRGTSASEFFALKRLRDLNRVDRFLKELKALQTIDHPAIVRVLDSWDADVDPSKPFLVMPIAEQGDATKRLPLFQGNVQNVVQVGLQISQALEAAHAQGIIHRDIKPGNILFPGQGFEIWLSDFGICRIGDEKLTPDGVVMGPRGFAAPEIEAGNNQDIDASVDLYSLGQVMFYLLSGGRTFHRENVMAAEHAALFSGQQAQDLRLLLAAMVADKPHRIRTAGEVRERLHTIAEFPQRATTGLLTPALLSEWTNLRSNVAKAERIQREAKAVSDDRVTMLAATQKAIAAFIEADLATAAAQLNGPEIAVTAGSKEERGTFGRDGLIAILDVTVGLSAKPRGESSKSFNLTFGIGRLNGAGGYSAAWSPQEISGGKMVIMTFLSLPGGKMEVLSGESWIEVRLRERSMDIEGPPPGLILKEHQQRMAAMALAFAPSQWGEKHKETLRQRMSFGLQSLHARVGTAVNGAIPTR